MPRTTSARAARHETANSLSCRASSGYLRHQDRTRIRQIRSRARKERDLICKLHAQCTTPSAGHLLRQALQTVDLVDRYFLSTEFLQVEKAPARLSKWFEFVEECLENAVKKREFYETMLERYYPTETLWPGQAKAGRQQRSASKLVGSRAGNSSGVHLKVQTARRPRGRGDDKVGDSRPLTIAADAMSISAWSRAAGVRSVGGSSRSRSENKLLKKRLAKDDSGQ
jgi:hypothetical protein